MLSGVLCVPLSGSLCTMTSFGHGCIVCYFATQSALREDACLIPRVPQNLCVFTRLLLMLPYHTCASEHIKGSIGTDTKFLEHDPLPVARMASTDKRACPSHNVVSSSRSHDACKLTLPDTTHLGIVCLRWRYNICPMHGPIGLLLHPASLGLAHHGIQEPGSQSYVSLQHFYSCLLSWTA